MSGGKATSAPWSTQNRGIVFRGYDEGNGNLKVFASFPTWLGAVSFARIGQLFWALFAMQTLFIFWKTHSWLSCFQNAQLIFTFGCTVLLLTAPAEAIITRLTLDGLGVETCVQYVILRTRINDSNIFVVFAFIAVCNAK